MPRPDASPNASAGVPRAPLGGTEKQLRIAATPCPWLAILRPAPLVPVSIPRRAGVFARPQLQCMR